MSGKNVPIAVAHGDGIGPEIMDAVLKILKAAGARIDITEVVVGEKAYAAGEKNGISDADMKVLQQSRALLKAPLNTPQGKGFSSVNVYLRKLFDLYANIRPSLSLEPVIRSGAGKADLVLVRENIEDLYAGREYRPTPDTAIGLKVSTKSESERIIRTAFEYARANGREKVTAISKDNIQKFTDGTNFHQVFDEIAGEYPDIKAEFYIADIGIARTGARAQDFDVVVTQNMYGDIASDVVGEALGSIGVSGSANVGPKFGMFEAVHGTAPDIAGKGIANPSGLLMSAVMMLNYIGQNDVAEAIHNAWLKTLEDGIFTGEIYKKGRGRETGIAGWLKTAIRGELNTPVKQRAGTAGFAQAVIERLGSKPALLAAVDYSKNKEGLQLPGFKPPATREKFFITGVDIDAAYTGDPAALAQAVTPHLPEGAKLAEILTVRGDKVWPGDHPAFYSDCVTLRVIFEDADKQGEQEKLSAAAKMLEDFAKASAVEWTGTRMLTRTRLESGAPGPNNYR